MTNLVGKPRFRRRFLETRLVQTELLRNFRNDFRSGHLLLREYLPEVLVTERKGVLLMKRPEGGVSLPPQRLMDDCKK